MIEKRSIGDSTMAVTFRVPAEAGARSACVAGEFNDWSTTATPMVADEFGLATTIELDQGRSYRFRYFLDGERWENDWAADGYVGNEYGGDDSVVDLIDTAGGPPSSNGAPPRPKASRARRPAKAAKTAP